MNMNKIFWTWIWIWIYAWQCYLSRWIQSENSEKYIFIAREIHRLQPCHEILQLYPTSMKSRYNLEPFISTINMDLKASLFYVSGCVRQGGIWWVTATLININSAYKHYFQRQWSMRWWCKTVCQPLSLPHQSTWWTMSISFPRHSTRAWSLWSAVDERLCVISRIHETWNAGGQSIRSSISLGIFGLSNWWWICHNLDGNFSINYHAIISGTISCLKFICGGVWRNVHQHKCLPTSWK